MIYFVEAIRNKISNSKAFTLAEALVATLIMLLVTVIVATGIPAAANAYNNVVTAANAEVLMSTAMTALRNELVMAKDINIPGGTSNDEGVSAGPSIEFYNEAAASMSKISNTGGDIMYQRYSTDSLVVNSSDLSPAIDSYNTNDYLISREASDKDKDLHVTYDSVGYDNGVVVFYNLRVTKKGDDTAAIRPKYMIRVLGD